MPTRHSQRGELLAKVCVPTTPDETERLKIREDGEQMKGKEKGGAGGGNALTCGAASTLGSHV